MDSDLKYFVDLLSILLPLQRERIAGIIDGCKLDGNAFANIVMALSDSGALDLAGYLEAYPDLKSAAVNPLRHYLQHGIYERRILKAAQPMGSAGAATQPKNPTKILSCPMLRSRLIFSYGEITSCCAVNECKSPVLARYNEPGEFDAKEVLAARKKIEQELNTPGATTVCSGCAFVREMPVEPEPPFCDMLNLGECHTCNLRCIYCNNNRAGECGQPVKALMLPVVQKLLRENLLAPNALISIAGGEPFIMPDFEETLRLILESTTCQIEINSNLTVWSEAAAEAMRAGRLTIRSSLDAGTEETFKKVKGRDLFWKASGNAKRYAAINPYALTLKYICLPENSTDADLSGIMLLLRQGITRLWIDFNFMEPPSPEVMDFAGKLKAMASTAGAEIIMGYGADLNYAEPVGIQEQVEKAYFKYISQIYSRIPLNVQEAETGAKSEIPGVIEKITFDRRGNLNIRGWAWSRTLGAPKFIRAYLGDRVIFTGKPHKIRNDVAPDARAQYDFHSPANSCLEAVKSNKDKLAVYATFDGAHFVRLPQNQNAWQ